MKQVTKSSKPDSTGEMKKEIKGLKKEDPNMSFPLAGAIGLSIHPVDRESGQVKRTVQLPIPKNLSTNFKEELNKRIQESLKNN